MGTWLVCMIVLFIVLMARKRMMVAAVLTHRRKKGRRIMEDMIREFVGKEVIIDTVSGSGGISGTLESVDNGWAVVKGLDYSEMQTINLEYVVRVREYPRNKNGKRKWLFG
ncbi:MAG: hypothetical protein IKR73_09870 [Oscillospiraceae bacterium]|nr:hypothetical protein [Oscillospiraceae bacterium]